jgi:hypothetical protein
MTAKSSKRNYYSTNVVLQSYARSVRALLTRPTARTTNPDRPGFGFRFSDCGVRSLDGRTDHNHFCSNILDHIQGLFK